jgi:hypothetical protein
MGYEYIAKLFRPRSASTLADEPETTIAVACSKCSWQAEFSRADLIAMYGREHPCPTCSIILLRQAARRWETSRTGAGRITSTRLDSGQCQLSPAADISLAPASPLCAITGCEQVQQKSSYSMTSSAVICMISGTVRPSAFAVLRLMTSSTLIGCITGSSAGFSPLRMRST